MKNNVVIRELEERDVSAADDLLLRLKRLNGEFDSIFNVAENAKENAQKHLMEIIKEKDKHLALVAERDGKLIGVIALNFNYRRYYLPEIEARIIEFYIMPEGRRGGVGRQLINRVYEELKKKKCTLITAEFPALNPIAMEFYKDLGFREIVGVYGKLIEK